ncbi:putative nucleoside hydrolase [Talaromyces proteolyticus]|uniref:Nucleoside hydrolase n=1 Tax=Talaromyces proteolyticus TaxID=1131652 RepID=A0AAD4KW75_9EURO|nr:putative nucleoside hydrolase [Talaromyces proteolyticus]KAH8697434.1 putative nucleoside hydrolase [Talaromyces proteolyticus]
MAPKAKIIIDTDPGIDDILAMLLAFASSPEEIEVLLISLTFGNIEVQRYTLSPIFYIIANDHSCLRNVISMLHIIERETQWRKEQGKPEGFDALRARKPIVAVGAQEPLDDQKMLADYFHGKDGLGGIHFSHPHLTPGESWEHLFAPMSDPDVLPNVAPSSTSHQSFIPSRRHASDEILHVLSENEPDTITIVAVGPLTNLALAAAKDPETFLRVKEVVVMGGAINEAGNVTPVGEFNAYADSVAAARVFALTSPNPQSTIPVSTKLRAYPSQLSKPLTLKLFPLDITLKHNLTRGDFDRTITPLLQAGSPLAEWVSAFMAHVFQTLERLHQGHEGASASLSLHDPVCVWYALTAEDTRWKPTVTSPEDIRIETVGHWTRGMCVVDRRNRHKVDSEVESHSDHGLWLSSRAGNRVIRMEESPGGDAFGMVLLKKLFE